MSRATASEMSISGIFHLPVWVSLCFILKIQYETDDRPFFLGGAEYVLPLIIESDQSVLLKNFDNTDCLSFMRVCTV